MVDIMRQLLLNQYAIMTMLAKEKSTDNDDKTNLLWCIDVTANMLRHEFDRDF